MSRCMRMCLKEGRFLGLGAQHCLTKSLNPSGQLDGIGSWSELLPTPQMMAELSTFLYGISQVRSSHKQTPKLQMSTFSLQGSFLMTSGAIQATVPAKLMHVDWSPPQARDVPKSLILMISFRPINILKDGTAKVIVRNTLNLRRLYLWQWINSSLGQVLSSTYFGLLRSRWMILWSWRYFIPDATCRVQSTSRFGGTRSFSSRRKLNRGPWGQYSIMMQ